MAEHDEFENGLPDTILVANPDEEVARRSRLQEEHDIKGGPTTRPNVRINMRITPVQYNGRRIALPWLLRVRSNDQRLSAFRGSDLSTNRFSRVTILGRTLLIALLEIPGVEEIDVDTYAITIYIGEVFRWSIVERAMMRAIYTTTGLRAGSFQVSRVAPESQTAD